MASPDQYFFHVFLSGFYYLETYVLYQKVRAFKTASEMLISNEYLRLLNLLENSVPIPAAVLGTDGNDNCPEKGCVE